MPLVLNEPQGYDDRRGTVVDNRYFLSFFLQLNLDTLF